MTASASHSSRSNDLKNVDFNMKYRLTGAGLLISLGVVILPWLLGSYSVNREEEVLIKPAEERNTNIEDNSIQIADESDIKVFVSKIKPVDSEGRQIYEAKKGSTNGSETSEKSSNEELKIEEVKEKLKAKLDQKIDKKETKKALDTPKKEIAQKIIKTNKLDVPIETKEKVEQGYIVSVGVFLKQAGADRVMTDLKQKGFNPSSSESTSSKGLATRVWLGPFSTRAAAGKERSKLEQIVGEKGWIIRYP